jgi:hypothetical protein
MGRQHQDRRPSRGRQPIRAYERLPFALTSSTLMLVGATATMTNALARDADYRDDGELNLKEGIAPGMTTVIAAPF